MESNFEGFRALIGHLQKYGYHLGNCHYLVRTCICGHPNNNHFQHGSKPCAHCDCKRFEKFKCTCGWAKVKKLLKLKG